MKLAFCFLSFGDIVHQRAWKEFFSTAPATAYRIWLHRKDRQEVSELPGVTCVPTHPTNYARFSLVEAQQLMFEAALRDEEVTKCMLLSGDTVPLQPFEVVAPSIMSHSKGILAWEDRASKDQVARERSVRREAWPEDWEWVWRTAQQWCVLTREHVQLLSKHWELLVDVFEQSRTPDEHVYPVFFHGVRRLDDFLRQPFIYVDWLHATSRGPCRLRHRLNPRTFHAEDLTSGKVSELRQGTCAMLRKVCERYECPPLWTDPGTWHPAAPEGTGKVSERRGAGNAAGGLILTPEHFPFAGAVVAGSGRVLTTGHARSASIVLSVPEPPANPLITSPESRKR